MSSERVLGEVPALGPLAAVVHSAASGVIRPALETEDKHWDWTLNANARALLALARRLRRRCRAARASSRMSSLGSTRVLENYVLVGVSKAALESLVRYLAVELAPRGIRVNACRPAWSRRGRSSTSPTATRCWRRPRTRTPAGRMVEPEDVAGAVMFLCSPDAEMVCGHVLVVDGGYSLPV